MKNFEKIKVSIIMPVYNSELFLKDSISSILVQTHENFEFLIADDGSTDRSLEILNDFAKKDKRITVIENKKNIGMYKICNDLIKISTGKYIVRFDSDDISKPDRIYKQIQFMEQHPKVDFSSGNVNLISNEGNFICKAWRPRQKKIISEIENRNWIVHPATILKKEVFEKELYDESYITAGDWEFWKRLIKKGFIYKYQNRVVIFYRLNLNSVRKIWDTGADPAYFFANKCFHNRRKISALKYLGKIKKENIKKYMVKLFLPYFFVKLINSHISKS